MKRIFGIFSIKKEERWVAFLAMCLFAILNVLQLIVYADTLTLINIGSISNGGNLYKLSGFDSITYKVLRDWGCGYNVFRHPLLAYFMWPFTKLNEFLMSTTGMNWAIYITAVLLVLCATYSFLFLSRTFYQIIGTRKSEAYVLTMMVFSFAYVMLATIAPDHFCASMLAITLTLYVCGLKLQKGRALNWWQTVVMFFFTAGISLNNGLKTFLMALMTRRKRFFKPGYLLLAVLLPSALMWGMARFTYATFVHPKEVARIEKKKAAQERLRMNIEKKVADTISVKDSAAIAMAVDSQLAGIQAKKERKRKMSAYYKHTGEPIAKGEFSRWTDISTSRLDVAVECLFGEAIMLHEDYLLADVLVSRPVIVHYRNWGNYIVEGLLLLFFCIGIWVGRKEHFLWTALSFFLLDMVLHMGLGFGINEVFIMSAHYMFVLPLAMGYVLPALEGKRRKAVLGLFTVLTAYLWVWNVALLVQYLYC